MPDPRDQGAEDIDVVVGPGPRLDRRRLPITAGDERAEGLAVAGGEDRLGPGLHIDAGRRAEIVLHHGRPARQPHAGGRGPFQLQVAVGQVQQHHPVGLDHPEVGADRLGGEQMGRHAVGGEGVDQQEIESVVRDLLQGLARVAERHRHLALGAALHEAELGRIEGDPHDQGIDLEELQGVGRPGEGGDRAGPQAHRAHAHGRMQGLDRADGRRDGRARTVIGRGDAALLRPLGLGAVQGRAMHHDLDHAVDRRGHAHQLHLAEEAAEGLPLSLEQLVVADEAERQDDHGVDQPAPAQQEGRAAGDGQQDDDGVHAGDLRRQ